MRVVARVVSLVCLAAAALCLLAPAPAGERQLFQVPWRAPAAVGPQNFLQNGRFGQSPWMSAGMPIEPDPEASVATLGVEAIAQPKPGAFSWPFGSAPAQKGDLVTQVPICQCAQEEDAVGEGYVVIPLKLKNSKGKERTVHFILDSGLSTTMVTPALRDWMELPAPKGGGLTANGFAAHGQSTMEVVPLGGASIAGCGTTLPRMNAVVLDFPQADNDDDRYDIQGMLGMEFVKLFDLDIDFPAGMIRMWAPGEGMKAAREAGLIAVPVSVIPGDILGIRVAAGDGTSPFLGIVDTGAAFSLMNTPAGKLSKLPLQNEPGQTGISATGVDGRATMLFSRTTDLVMLGFKEYTENAKWGDSESLSQPDMLKFPKIRTGVGEVAVFEQLLSTPGHPWTGPAGLLGLDVWTKTRIMFGAAPQGFLGRERTIFIQPPEQKAKL